jgi:hypothetical protein
MGAGIFCRLGIQKMEFGHLNSWEWDFTSKFAARNGIWQISEWDDYDLDKILAGKIENCHGYRC